MAKGNFIMDDLKNELEELHQRYPVMKKEDLFIIWFLRAYVTEDLDAAAQAVTNGPKDKGVDGLLIDDGSRSVFVIQGKYRHKFGTGSENRSDVLSFAQLSHILTDRDNKRFQSIVEDADQIVAQKLAEARKRILNRGYRLWLYYVTLGKCSSGLRSEAEDATRNAPGEARFEMLDGRRLMLLMSDYLDGVAPPIPTLDLVMENGQGISVNGILQRYDSRSKIESWVFSMQGDAIAHLYEVGGKRLFARNIRGFMGETTDVNRSMESTLKKEPERFFYFNNGITILCDDAKKVSTKGKDILRVSNPQVINGQQTTRTLARKVEQARKSSVIVRVIQVPRNESNGDDYFDTLVSQIIEGTNWQNAIRPSDLVSNDRRQVELQRELRKRGYLYL
ncbi:MAG: AIPR family protein [Deltaproteobacteria bacterium]|nr:AIPR family protein [Deltaproteobacteria bacterium]